MDAITRGTTPTIEVVVEADLTDFTCDLSIGRYGKPFFTADNEQMTFTYADDVSTCAFRLTQEQTLACKPGETFMQIRAIKDNDAIATEPIAIEVLNVIEQSIIEDTFDTPTAVD